MSKYIDLASRIAAESGAYHLRTTIIEGALEWLDDHPDQVPGLTMARGDYNEWLEHVESLNVSNRGAVNMTLRRLGVNVPPPEPTNTEGDNNMSKFIDLYEAITESSAVTPDFSKGAMWALDFLDRNPDQAPGRTITESEYAKARTRAKGEGPTEAFPRRLVRHLGITIVPDPEPTNAELLEQLHDEYRMLPAQHLPGNGSLADYLDHKGVRAATDHD